MRYSGTAHPLEKVKILNIEYISIVVLALGLLSGIALAAIPEKAPEATGIPPHLKNYAKLYRQNPRQASVKWFNEARFGMMVHYGLTSVIGVHIRCSSASLMKT